MPDTPAHPLWGPGLLQVAGTPRICPAVGCQQLPRVSPKREAATVHTGWEDTPAHMYARSTQLILHIASRRNPGAWHRDGLDPACTRDTHPLQRRGRVCRYGWVPLGVRCACHLRQSCPGIPAWRAYVARHPWEIVCVGFITQLSNEPPSPIAAPQDILSTCMDPAPAPKPHMAR